MQPQDNKKATLSEVLEDDANYLDDQALSRMKIDLEAQARDQRNGGDFRFATLKSILECLEKNQTRLRNIETILTEANNK